MMDFPSGPYIDKESVHFLHNSFCPLKFLLNKVCDMPTEKKNLKIFSLHNEVFKSQKSSKQRLIFFLI